MSKHINLACYQFKMDQSGALLICVLKEAITLSTITALCYYNVHLLFLFHQRTVNLSLSNILSPSYTWTK